MIHLSKSKKHTTPKVNPNVNYGLRVMTKYQCSIGCNKCTTLVGDVDNGMAVHVWGWEYVVNLCTSHPILLGV